MKKHRICIPLSKYDINRQIEIRTETLHIDARCNPPCYNAARRAELEEEVRILRVALRQIEEGGSIIQYFDVNEPEPEKVSPVGFINPQEGNPNARFRLRTINRQSGEISTRHKEIDWAGWVRFANQEIGIAVDCGLVPNPTGTALHICQPSGEPVMTYDLLMGSGWVANSELPKPEEEGSALLRFSQAIIEGCGLAVAGSDIGNNGFGILFYLPEGGSVELTVEGETGEGFRFGLVWAGSDNHILAVGETQPATEPQTIINAILAGCPQEEGSPK